MKHSSEVGGTHWEKHLGALQPDKLGCLCVDHRQKEYEPPPTRIRDFQLR